MKNTKQLIILITIATITLLSCTLTRAPFTDEEETIESPAPDKFSLVRISTADGQLEDLLKAEAEKAKQLDRAPYVEFYADWCPPCNALRKSLSDERMIDAFDGTYIIQLDLDEWKSRLAGTGFNVVGIPVFFELDGTGQPTGRTITGGAWGEDIPENMAPPLKEFFRTNENLSART